MPQGRMCCHLHFSCVYTCILERLIDCHDDNGEHIHKKSQYNNLKQQAGMVWTTVVINTLNTKRKHIVTCQAHPVLVKKAIQTCGFFLCVYRIPGPVSCRCPEPRAGLLETPPRWHATIYCRVPVEEGLLGYGRVTNMSLGHAWWATVWFVAPAFFFVHKPLNCWM